MLDSFAPASSCREREIAGLRVRWQKIEREVRPVAQPIEPVMYGVFIARPDEDRWYGLFMVDVDEPPEELIEHAGDISATLAVLFGFTWKALTGAPVTTLEVHATVRKMVQPRMVRAGPDWAEDFMQWVYTDNPFETAELVRHVWRHAYEFVDRDHGLR